MKLIALLLAGLVIGSVALAGCSVLPDSVKTERQLLEETWNCMDEDDRAATALFIGKEEWMQLAMDLGTKEEIKEARDEECGSGGG